MRTTKKYKRIYAYTCVCYLKRVRLLVLTFEQNRDGLSSPSNTCIYDVGVLFSNQLSLPMRSLCNVDNSGNSSV